MLTVSQVCLEKRYQVGRNDCPNLLKVQNKKEIINLHKTEKVTACREKTFFWNPTVYEKRIYMNVIDSFGIKSKHVRLRNNSLLKVAASKLVLRG